MRDATEHAVSSRIRLVHAPVAQGVIALCPPRPGTFSDLLVGGIGSPPVERTVPTVTERKVRHPGFEERCKQDTEDCKGNLILYRGMV